MAQSPLFVRKLFNQTKVTTIATVIERDMIAYLGLSADIMPTMSLRRNSRVFPQLEIQKHGISFDAQAVSIQINELRQCFSCDTRLVIA